MKRENESGRICWVADESDPVDFRQCHRVYCFRCPTLRHCPLVGAQFRVSSQVQFRVVELSVEILNWEFSLPAFLDDIQHGCGCSHHEYLAFLNIVAICAALPWARFSRAPW